MSAAVSQKISNCPEFKRPVPVKSSSSDLIDVRLRRTYVSDLPVSKRVRRRTVKRSLFNNRLIDDLCAIAVGASGLFFALSLARMILMK
jgi:hypothetical protein